MDGEIEVAWFVLAQLFSCQAILCFVFCLSICTPRVLRESLLVEKKAVRNSR